MKQPKLYSAAILVLALLLASCQQNNMQQPSAENNSPQQNTTSQQAQKAEATLLWSGEYAADGCGFEVILNGKKYKPENEEAIDASFKTEEPTAVALEFVRLAEQIDRRCGLSPQSRAMDGIRVVSVKRR